MNLESETRNGYFIPADMKKVWAIEIKLLIKLLDVCKKYNLNIFAEGGTLLGTVRHHGFIPWDDDIDMAMLRDDYDKLQAIAIDEFKAPYFFQSGYTDLFPSGMSRIRMDGTAAILPQTLNAECHQGIFIDIFPLDAVPDDDKTFKQLLAKKEIEKEKMMLYCNNHLSFSNLKYDWIILKAKLGIWITGFHAFFAKYDNLIKQYNDKPHRRVSIFSWLFKKRYLRDRDWYNETIYMQFEDIMIPVPKEYDKILTTQYGEYMKPVNESTMHGGFLVLDTERSYTYYLPRLRREHKMCERKQWLKHIGVSIKGYMFF